MNRSKPIQGELLRLKEEIEQYAIDYGLTYYPVVFEVCNYDTICILAAQGGFPSRYPHWRFGMEYDQLSKGNIYGFQKIYELVINTDPCYAYLLSSNRIVDQKLVMAHVYGHADFFKNNAWFRTTDKRMMDVMANHGTKIRKYMNKYGQDRVEAFIDAVNSLENLLDVNVLFETAEVVRKREELERTAQEEELREDDDDVRSKVLRSYMKSKEKGEFSAEEVVVPNDKYDFKKIDENVKGTRDIMKFLMQNAPIEEWQSDIIGCLREEAYYFLPQRMTKIMNEGWASYWHSKIMTNNALKSSEIIDFADVHSGVMAMSPQSINPYKIGIELFRDIEHRWDTGKFGKEYLECTDMNKKESWDMKLGLGREKIFEVRKSHNDITFLDEYFTEEFCQRQQIFTYKFNPRTGRNEIETRDFKAIKAKLLQQLTNFGQPLIEIESSNYNNRGEMLLRHVHQGVDLDLSFAADTMKNIFMIWKRPVNIATVTEEKEYIYVYDGESFKPVKN
ncbi:SpoVR family protein [Halobacteriovorax marinus]|uniref:SpoVR family protein n=1 Tax=Halobacteriovorax marinus TaxID=97084 RepID=UPI000BC2EA0D|nr:SpoVR family protein [Halobacteriovorax marinus]ATH07715.1 SpoVR family protein [Halobacteriovorax marinus]